MTVTNRTPNPKSAKEHIMNERTRNCTVVGALLQAAKWIYSLLGGMAIVMAPQQAAGGVGGSLDDSWSSPAQQRPWWDDYPLIIQNADVATIQALNGDCGFNSSYADPSWGIYAQKTVSSTDSPALMHNAGLKFITYYETFGTSTSFILELGSPTAEGYHSVYRCYWSWNLLDTADGPFRWAGAQNYFDAEDFCGAYTRLHPIYGADGRAMTYPDGAPATGYFDNDHGDPRKSRVYDAAASKDVLGNYAIDYQYGDEVAGNPSREGGLLNVEVGGQVHLVGHISFGKDTACPMWIDQQRSSILHSVGQGQIDGIWADNFSAWDSFGYPPIRVAFGDWSVAGFRDCLAARFSSSELAAMGIGDLSTFDVRCHLLDRLAALGGNPSDLDDAQWNDNSWLENPIWRAYTIYKRQIGTEALNNYYHATKEAARRMGNADLGVLGNDIPLYSLGYTRGNLDVVSTELSPGWHMGASSRGFMMPPVGRFAPAYRLGREHAKSRLMNIWMYLAGDNASHKEKPGVVNTLYYEMLANHALPMLQFGHPSCTQNETVNGGFFGFVKKSRATFGGRDSLADVGVYYSSSSILAFITPAGFHDMDNQPHAWGYSGWGAALGNLHYQYRPIPEWKLTRDTLSKLRVLIVPNAEVLDTVDVANVIKPWVGVGGRLIVTGNSGNRQGELGNFSPHPAGLALACLTGVSSFPSAPATKLSKVGAGRVHFIRENIGLSYFKASTISDRASLLPQFAAAMSEALGETETILTPISFIPESVGINLYQDPAAERLFIDVNNYDVDLAHDAVTDSPSITFAVEAPKWLRPAQTAKLRAQILSPAATPPTATLTWVRPDRIQVELGPVTHYASVVATSTSRPPR